MSDPSDIACILRLAFGRAVSATPIPVPSCERGMAFALDDHRLPPRVLLLRYSPQQQSRAFAAFTAMRALRSLNFPVPDVYYLGWSHQMRYLLLLCEYIEGRTEEGQPYAFFARIGPHFAQTLAQLHQLVWDDLPDLPIRPLGLVISDLAQQVRDLELRQLHAIMQWLEAQAPRIREQPHTVLHGNYLLPHVIADPPRVIGVLNWEYAALGDPRFDIGYTSAALGVYGYALSNQFIEAYEAALGQPIEDRLFWEVLGALRLLVGISSTLVNAHPTQRADMQEQATPAWVGLLAFVVQRLGLEI